ncbi:MAG TPA: hypothetical protein VLK85_19245, partial [Ramlibacter sp.]|nr:hypothetical protein [Ramlibacter sp.]
MRVRQACATAAGSTRLAAFTLALCALLAGCGGGGDEPVAASPGLTVPKARCGPNDRVEAGLQGQVPMAERAAGFQGYNCNLALASQVRSDRGANTWEQFVSLRDRQGRLCGYAGSAPPGLGGLNTIVVDLTDPDRAVQTAVLTTPAMAGPGEGLRAHQGRGLLIAARYNTGPSASAEAHGFDVYDVGTDCRHPQLLASTTALAFDTAGLPAFPLAGAWPQRDNAYGHEGAISPDGLTYYISDFPHGVYHAVDITDPTRPLLIGTFQPPGAVWKGPFNFEAGVHGLSLSNDGTRGYFTTGAFNVLADAMVPQTGSWRNGFLVV